MVYLGIDAKTGEEVAVKVLPKVRGKLSKERTLDKIEKEVDIMDSLGGHPGVVKLLSTFEADNEVMLVSELCNGGDLQRLLDVSARLLPCHLAPSPPPPLPDTRSAAP